MLGAGFACLTLDTHTGRERRERRTLAPTRVRATSGETTGLVLQDVVRLAGRSGYTPIFLQADEIGLTILRTVGCRPSGAGGSNHSQC